MEYRIKPGDTLFEIAQRFGTTVERLIELNQIEDVNNLRVGQIIIIPDEIEEDNDEEINGIIPATNFAFERVNGLLIIFFTNKAVYQQGERVRLNLIKINTSNSSITLNYRTGQRYDFAVQRNDQQVWLWSSQRRFTTAIREVTLQPNESLIFEETWNQVNNNDQQVNSGVYQIEGWNVAREIEDERLEVSVKIR